MFASDHINHKMTDFRPTTEWNIYSTAGNQHFSYYMLQFRLLPNQKEKTALFTVEWKWSRDH